MPIILFKEAPKRPIVKEVPMPGRLSEVVISEQKKMLGLLNNL